jgi:hypothetical protein
MHRFDTDVERSPIEGVIVCAVYPARFGNQPEAYRIDINSRLIRLTSTDLPGMRNAWFTLVQVRVVSKNLGIFDLMYVDHPRSSGASKRY